MKKRIIDVLILLAYAVPWVFLGMLGDYAFSHALPTFLTYVLTLAAMLALGWYCGKTKRMPLLLIGNLLSLLTTCLCIEYAATEQWNYYFKAFPLAIRVMQLWGAYLALQLALWWLRKNNA